MPSEPAVIEVQPEFPGGIQAMYKHINQNFRYPKSASKYACVGKVMTSFIVETDGSIVLDSLDTSQLSFKRKKQPTEEEKQAVITDVAQAVTYFIEAMPKWKPGTQDGRNVRVKYHLPFNLALE